MEEVLTRSGVLITERRPDMRNWKLPFMRFEYQAGVALFILVPLWAAVASWQVSPWLAPVAMVVTYFASREVVFAVEILLADFLFDGGADEFNDLTEQVEIEFWGEDPVKD
jgi:hypothetical protein